MKTLEILKEKIIQQSELKWTVNRWRFKGEKLVFTNGCFDILHQGHIDYLSKAKDLGSKLIIGLNSDSSVKMNKGKNRPHNPFEIRKKNLLKLGFVDQVIRFNSKTPLNLIKKIKPDIVVKGGDYKKNNVVGNKISEVKIFKILNDYSSTSLINKINKSNS